MSIAKERPILFSAPMVKAVLDGSKMQTRRIMKPQPYFTGRGLAEWIHWKTASTVYASKGLGAGEWVKEIAKLCPYGQVGDRLWVREAWRQCIRPRPVAQAMDHTVVHGCEGILYRADEAFREQRAPGGYDKGYGGRWKPSIHMPRWASRITLEVTEVRVERLQDITYSDINAEGVTCPDHDFSGGFCVGECPALARAWIDLWESINGGDGWTANPWVWVVEFKPTMSSIVE